MFRSRSTNSAVQFWRGRSPQRRRFRFSPMFGAERGFTTSYSLGIPVSPTRSITYRSYSERPGRTPIRSVDSVSFGRPQRRIHLHGRERSRHGQLHGYSHCQRFVPFSPVFSLYTAFPNAPQIREKSSASHLSYVFSSFDYVNSKIDLF